VSEQGLYRLADLASILGSIQPVKVSEMEKMLEAYFRETGKKKGVREFVTHGQGAWLMGQPRGKQKSFFRLLFR
jgi:hypothetical protein